MTAGNRCYGQMCPIARSLDVLGERWTLLIVRELLLGPKRFKDLLAPMPSMGTNRLSDRLKALESDGVVVHETLGPPSGAQVYALSERGEGLRAPVVALAQWGAAVPIDERIDPRTARAALLALVRCATAPAEAYPSTREIHDLTVGDERLHLLLDRHLVLPRSGPAPLTPDVTLRCDLMTLLDIDAGALTPETAGDSGAELVGSADAKNRLFEVFSRRAEWTRCRLAPPPEPARDQA
jgi:DNA-binding HxlR family transcriptional regulator